VISVFYTACLYVCIFFLFATILVNKDVYTLYMPYHTIPNHTILGRRGLDLPPTTPRPIKMAQNARPAGMGRKGGKAIQV